jgi:hypothetical protein
MIPSGTSIFTSLPRQSFAFPFFTDGGNGFDCFSGAGSDTYTGAGVAGGVGDAFNGAGSGGGEVKSCGGLSDGFGAGAAAFGTG